MYNLRGASDGSNTKTVVAASCTFSSDDVGRISFIPVSLHDISTQAPLH